MRRAGDSKYTSLSRIFAVKESKDGSDFLSVLCWVVKENDRVEESIAGMIYE